MPRPPADYRALHAAADVVEGRLARAFARSVEKLQAGVSINDLANAIARGDVKGALALLPVAAVKDSLSPAGTIVRDAVIRGGKVGAEMVNEAVSR